MQNGQVDVLKTITFDDLIASDAWEAAVVALAMGLTIVPLWEFFVPTRRPLIVDRSVRGERGVRKGRERERAQSFMFEVTDETERATAGAAPIEERIATEALLDAKAIVCNESIKNASECFALGVNNNEVATRLDAVLLKWKVGSSYDTLQTYSMWRESTWRACTSQRSDLWGRKVQKGSDYGII